MPEETKTGLELKTKDAKIEEKPQYKFAPTLQELLAYWETGRTPEEGAMMMNRYKTKCAKTGDEIYYIPERGEDGAELPAPTDLIKRPNEQ